MSSESELDRRIEIQRKIFYQALLAKKRKIRRTWMEISCLTNAHLLQTLPYRAMLGHVGELAAEREATRLANSLLEIDNKSDNNIDSGASGSGTYDFSSQTDDEETDEGIDEEAETAYSSNNEMKSTKRT